MTSETVESLKGEIEILKARYELQLAEAKEETAITKAHVKALDALVSEFRNNAGLPIFVKNVNAARAKYLQIELLQRGPTWAGRISMNTFQVMRFLEYEIKEEFRLDKVKNPYRDVIEVMKLTAEISGGTIRAFKTSVNTIKKEYWVIELLPDYSKEAYFLNNPV